MDSCPTCGRGLKRILDFPFILLKDIKKENFEEHVRKSQKFRNITNEEKIGKIRFVVEKYIEPHINNLQEHVGSVIPREELLFLLDGKWSGTDGIYSAVFPLPDSLYCFWITDDKENEGNANFLIACADYREVHSICPVARLQYEGRISID